jgi:hypothetical protein
MGFFSQKKVADEPRPRWPRRLAGLLAILMIAVLLVYAAGLGVEHFRTRLPMMNSTSAWVAVEASEIELLTDLTGVDAYGKLVARQEIFPALLKMINTAERFVVLDMFLINRFGANDTGGLAQRDISAELVAALIQRKETVPELFILFITDPINGVYGEECPEVLQPLVDAGGHVVLTDLRMLPDSNRVYSPFYRVLQPLATRLPGMHDRLLHNPFDTGAQRVSPAQLLRLMNFKANHRKIAIASRANGSITALVSSANPHTASSAHSNVGLLMRDGPFAEMLEGEYRLALAVLLNHPELCFSQLRPFELVRELERHLDGLQQLTQAVSPAAAAGERRLQYLTDRAIGQRADRMLREAEAGDRVDMLMFYLADPAVLEGIENAVSRGVSVRVVLDPSRDAFGHSKNGMPNSVTARRLHEWAAATGGDLVVRWMLTHGEQAHFKLLRVHNRARSKEELLVGSANFTRRNLRGYNLEAAVYVENGRRLGEQAGGMFDRVWNNRDGVLYTVPYAQLAPGTLRWWLGRVWVAFGTATGLSTY